jgi:hypothetical protein
MPSPHSFTQRKRLPQKLFKMEKPSCKMKFQTVCLYLTLQINLAIFATPLCVCFRATLAMHSIWLNIIIHHIQIQFGPTRLQTSEWLLVAGGCSLLSSAGSLWLEGAVCLHQLAPECICVWKGGRDFHVPWPCLGSPMNISKFISSINC